MILQFQIDWNGNGNFSDVDNPVNADELMVDVIFTSRFPNAVISGLNFEWTGDVAGKLNAYKTAGNFGGSGIGVGVGLRVLGCSVSFFEGYIHLADKATLWSCDSVTAPSVQIGRADWFMLSCRGLVFSEMASDSRIGKPGYINPILHVKKTPYRLTKYRSKAEQVTLELSELALIDELKMMVYEEQKAVNKLIGDVQTLPPVNIAVIGMILMDIINIVLFTVFLLEILLALIKIIEKVLAYYFQVKKHKLCMEWETIFGRICERLNMDFSSTIFVKRKGLTWMPQKNVIPNKLNPFNFADPNDPSPYLRPQDEGFNFPNNPHVYGYPDENPADWIEGAKKFFNAEIVITKNSSTGRLTVNFEEAHYWNNVGQYQMTNTGEVGNTFNLPLPYGTNFEDCPSTLSVAWQTDAIDENTRARYAGTTCSVTVSPVFAPNPHYVSHSPGRNISLPAARAKRKEYMSETDLKINEVINQFGGVHGIGVNLVNGLINTLSPVINFYGGSNAQPLQQIQSFSNIIPNIGWMELSSDDTGVPKVFIGYQSGTDWLISKSDEDLMSAQALLNDGAGKDLATRGNQMRLYKNHTFELCCEDYNVLSVNNVIKDPEGNLGKMFDFKWDIHSERALDAEYGVYMTDTSNLVESVSVDGNKQ